MTQIDADEFANIEGDALVEFFSPTCGPCRMLQKTLEGKEDDYDAPFYKIDVFENPELAQSMGIRSVPVLALIQDGQVTDQLVGNGNEDVLLEQLQTL